MPGAPQVTRADADRRAVERFREEAARAKPLLKLAEEVEALEKQAREFPADLDARRTAVEVQRLTGGRQTAAETRAKTAGLLESAEGRREFDGARPGRSGAAAASR